MEVETIYAAVYSKDTKLQISIIEIIHVHRDDLLGLFRY